MMQRIERFFKKLKKESIADIMQEFAWISSYSMQYKAEIAWYMLLGVVGTALSLAGSILSKYIIDAVTGYDSGGLLIAAIFYGLMQLSRSGISALTSRINAKINIKVSQQIQSDIYGKIMDADWESASQYHSGDLLNRMTGDVNTISSSVLGWLPDLVTRLLQFAGTLAVILYYDVTLALLALLSAPVSLIMSRLVLGKMRQRNKEMRQHSSELMMFNSESFQNIQTVKAFNLVPQYRQKLKTLQEKHAAATLDYNLFSLRNTALMSLVGTVVTGICLGWGIYRLWSGDITYGTMTLFLQLSGSLSAAFSALVGIIPNAISAATAAGRVMAASELPKEDHTDDSAVASFLQRYGDSKIQLITQELAFGYKDAPDVFSNVQFRAQSGEVVALVGPSGGGKTTMLRILLGIVKPRTGMATLCEQNQLEKLNLSASTRRMFAYIPQENTVFSGTVAENLRMVKPDATDEELHAVLKLACADKFIAQQPFGIHTQILEDGGGFSQGQIQRLSIARALLTKAPILLMDEATSALDITTERQILHNIMQSKHCRICIVATHRPSVLSVCDRVYKIGNGSVTQASENEIEVMMKDF